LETNKNFSQLTKRLTHQISFYRSIVFCFLFFVFCFFGGSTMEESQTTSARSEVIKFLLLVGVCVVVVLVVAQSRPLIFKQIVPAVMGEGLSEPVGTTDTAVDETDVSDTPADSENMDAAADEEDSRESSVDEADSENEAVDEEAVEEVEEVEAETAVSTEKTHTVQVGDTVYSIARKYSVTVEEIAKANNLADVNRVVLGQTLIIPQP